MHRLMFTAVALAASAVPTLAGPAADKYEKSEAALEVELTARRNEVAGMPFIKAAAYLDAAPSYRFTDISFVDLSVASVNQITLLEQMGAKDRIDSGAESRAMAHLAGDQSACAPAIEYVTEIAATAKDGSKRIMEIAASLEEAVTQNASARRAAGTEKQMERCLAESEAIASLVDKGRANGDHWLQNCRQHADAATIKAVEAGVKNAPLRKSCNLRIENANKTAAETNFKPSPRFLQEQIEGVQKCAGMLPADAIAATVAKLQQKFAAD